MWAKRSILPLYVVLLSCGSSAPAPESGGGAADGKVESVTNGIARSYVKLVLALGQHDPDYVDAYYGPPEWRTEAEANKRPLQEIGTEAQRLHGALFYQPTRGLDELARLRRDYLLRQLESLSARVAMLSGKKLRFDDESKALYDAVAPTYPEQHFVELQAELERALPGKGELIDRYEAFRNDFLIPKAKLDSVFQAAIAECRERTLRHIAPAENETFTVEYVTGKPWSAYNWYKGKYTSLIQVNTDLPTPIDRAIDLACHEGYPGHHVYNFLLEKNLVNGRGWVEFTVLPLFSPLSLIAEGSANFGIEVAFPGHERVEFESKVLFPLAGIDPSRAPQYARVQELVDQLSYAGNEAARRYLDGEIDAAQAVDWLRRYALLPRERAEQRVTFFDRYRSYVINYNLGKDLVRRHIELSAGKDDPARVWDEFEKLLSSPRLPSGLAR